MREAVQRAAGHPGYHPPGAHDLIAAWLARAAPWLMVALITVLVVYPLFELARQPAGSLASLWKEASELPRLGSILWRTVWLALGSMALATLAALVLAWCRNSLAGKVGAAAQIVAVVPLVVPPLAGVTGWAFLLSPSVGYVNELLRWTPVFGHLSTGPFDVYSLSWIIIITGTYLIPYAFIFVQAGLANIDPRMEDAARVFGSGWWDTQRRIVLPLLRPALVYGGGVVALLALGQFTAPLLLGRTQGIDVITTQLYRLTGVPPPNYPLASFIALPILFLALAGVAAQRRALRGGLRFMMTAKGAGRGRVHNRWLLVPVVLYSVFLVVPPLAGLALVALTPYWGAPLEPKSFTLDAFREIFANPLTSQAIWNSMKYSMAATVLCLILSLAAALVAARVSGPARRIIDYIVNIPIAVPAILFGMALLVSFSLGPLTSLIKQWFGISLYGSGVVIVLAYVILVLPHGTRLAMSGIAQIDPVLESAARVFGSSGAGAVVRVLAPLLRRHLVGAAMLMFILCSHEFGASVLLIGPETQVMSTVLYGQWDTGSYPQVAALALVMVGVAVTGLAVLAAFDRDRRVVKRVR